MGEIIEHYGKVVIALVAVIVIIAITYAIATTVTKTTNSAVTNGLYDAGTTKSDAKEAVDKALDTTPETPETPENP